MSAPKFAELEIGSVVAKSDLVVTREDLVRYAGASGDTNPIHYNDAVAAKVGLPGVLAHGMLTAGIALQVVVDPFDGAALTVSVRVGRLDAEARTARLDITVGHGGQTVLGKTQALVRLRD